MACSLWGGLMFVSIGQKLCTTKLEPQNLLPTKTCHVSMGNSTYVSMPKQPEPPQHEPRNLNLKTCHVSMGNPTYVSMPRQPKPPKHVTFQEICFGPMCSSSPFPHAIPIHAPWPIHETLDLFLLHITIMYFSVKL